MKANSSESLQQLFMEEFEMEQEENNLEDKPIALNHRFCMAGWK